MVAIRNVRMLGDSAKYALLTERRRDRIDKSSRIRSHTKLPLKIGQPGLSENFWHNLTIFVTGIITQMTDLKELHNRKVRHTARERENNTLPHQVKLPSVFVRLSDIIPSLVTAPEKELPEKDNDGNYINKSQEEKTSAAWIRGRREPWAYDYLEVVFKGLQAGLEDPNASTSLPRVLNYVEDVILRVTDKRKFRLLRGQVDKDVLYNPRRGEFYFRIRQAVGQGVIDTLTSRVKSIDRLFDFLAAMSKPTSAVRSESVTLRKVAFRYGPLPPPDQPAPLDVPQKHPWRVSLDLATNSIGIVLEKNNPHLRVLPMLKGLANAEGGLNGLIRILPLTLPILTALDEIEDKWAALELSGQGGCEVIAHSLDLYRVRYRVPPKPLKLQGPRQLDLCLRMRHKKGTLLWHLFRPAAAHGAAPIPDDDFRAVLKPIWDGRGEGWRGLSTGASGYPSHGSHGISALLMRVDDSVRGLAVSSPGVASKGAPASTASGSSFTQLMQFSSQRSNSSTPLTSQSQSGGRGKQGSVVVLD
jgi:mediator of RNA polymerase II transcription subunit 14